MNTKKKPSKRFKKAILKTSLVFFTTQCVFIGLPATALAAKIDSAKSTVNLKFIVDFDKDFREGRDLIDRGEWAKASEKFNELFVKYPGNKSLDAALYWLAFSYKKQNRLKETNAALERLLMEFPASSWADDAQVMKLEIGLPFGNTYSPGGFAASTILPTEVSAPLPAKPIIGGNVVMTASKQYEAALALQSGFYNSTPAVSLDREDEIKIAAFQSLLAADPKRAIEVMGDILTADSSASESLKQEILRVLRSPRLTKNQSFTLIGSGINKQFSPLLRETLIKSFQKEKNIKIRKEIIYALAKVDDDQSVNYLAQLYNSENDREIKKTIINSFGSQTGSFFQYAGVSGNLTSTLANTTSNRKIVLDKLFEIVGNEKDPELRRLAFSTLQRNGGWSESSQALDLTVRLYDAETDEEFKSSIIRALGASKQTQAQKKLIDIAGNDKSDRLKIEAIYALRSSKTPEALKFLEDLIK